MLNQMHRLGRLLASGHARDHEPTGRTRVNEQREAPGFEWPPRDVVEVIDLESERAVESQPTDKGKKSGPFKRPNDRNDPHAVVGSETQSIRTGVGSRDSMLPSSSHRASPSAGQSSAWSFPRLTQRTLHLALLSLALVCVAEGVFIAVHLLREPATTAASNADAVQAARPQVEQSPDPTLRMAVLDPPVASRRDPTTVAASSEPPRVAGRLTVRTDPPGVPVSVDGRSYGRSPLTIDSLGAGEHRVVVRGRGGLVQQTVRIEPGVVSTLVVPLAAGSPPSGWLSVVSPLELQMFEEDRLLGTTKRDRLLLEAGEHQIDLVHQAVGYRMRRLVNIEPGGTTRLSIDLPDGKLFINALPWAEVWIDGRPLGATPLGNISARVGPHDVLFRHPQLGEERRTIVVTVGAPTRISVDLKR